MRPSRSRRALLTLGGVTGLLMITTVIAGCDPVDPDPEDVALRDTRAVGHGSESLHGTPRLAYFGSLFAVPPGLDATDPEAVRRETVDAVQQRLSATFAAIGCDAVVQSDGQEHVGMTLQGCGLLQWTLDADLEARAEVEVEPCDAGTCAVAVAWDLDIGGLSIRQGTLPPAGFAGPARLRASLDPAAPMQWQTDPGFVLQTRGGRSFEALSSASFGVDADDCVDLDLGARLTLEQPDDELDERIGNVVVSVRGLRRCMDGCPTAGRVELSFGAGDVLGWEHDGSGTIMVEGPRGRTLEANLPCAEEPAGG